MEILVPLKMKGQFRHTRRKAIVDDFGDLVAGPIVEQTPWSNNFITDIACDAFTTETGVFLQGCVVGSGNTPAAKTDEYLDSFIAGTRTFVSGSASVLTFQTTTSPRYVQHEFTFRFGMGVAEGNVAEAGIAFTTVSSTAVPNASTTLAARSLNVDESGNPVVTSVQDDEFLDTSWRLRIFVPEDVVGSCQLDNDGVLSTITTTTRGGGMVASSEADASWQPWGLNSAISFVPRRVAPGSSVPTPGAWENLAMPGYNVRPSSTGRQTSESQGAYSHTPGTKVCERTIRWGLSNANFATGINLIQFGSGSGGKAGWFVTTFSPKIPKVATKWMDTTFRITLSN